MTKKELVRNVAAITGLLNVQAEYAINAALNIVKECIAHGEAVNIHGFGQLAVRRAPSRKVYDFNAKEVREIPSAYEVRFQAGSGVQRAIEDYNKKRNIKL